MYPRYENNLFKYWETFQTRIINLLRQNLKNKESIDLLKITEEVDENTEDVIILSLLPHYIQPGKKVNGQKITIVESQSNFIIHVKVS